MHTLIKSTLRKTIITASLAMAFAFSPLVTGSAHAGIQSKCKACHNFTSKKKFGPGLKNVVGRPAGTMPDMKYSPSLANGGWVWTEEKIRAWVCSSKDAIKVFTGDKSARVKMPPQKICSKEKQDKILAFLESISDKKFSDVAEASKKDTVVEGDTEPAEAPKSEKTKPSSD